MGRSISVSSIIQMGNQLGSIDGDNDTHEYGKRNGFGSCTPSLFRPAPPTRAQLQREVERAQQDLLDRRKDLEFAREETTKKIEEKTLALKANMTEYVKSGKKNQLLKQDITYALQMRREFLKSRQRTVEKIMLIERQEMVMMEQNLQSVTYDALKSNLSVMRKLQDQLSKEDAQELMDDVSETNAFAQDTMDILANPVRNAGAMLDWDDDELEQELQSMAKEQEQDAVIVGEGSHMISVVDDEEDISHHHHHQEQKKRQQVDPVYG